MSNEGARAAAVATPVDAGRRLMAIDAARGFALLGIYCVNIQSFAEPFGRFTVPLPPEGETPLGVALYYFVKIFCEGKFYPLFSLLFGMGLILQMRSVESRGGRFFGLYTRRLLVLMLIGLCHALLLWYGDILFIYAFAGLVLMAASRARAKVLLWVGVGLLAAVTVLGGALTGLAMAGAQQNAAATAAVSPGAAAETAPALSEEAFFDGAAEAGAADAVETDGLAQAAATSPFFRLIKGFRDGEINAGPEHPLWIATETRAYREGPFLDAFLFRAMTWGFFILFCFFGFGWHIVAMFFIGAGLMKLGLLDAGMRRWRLRLILLGLVVGLPGSALAAALPAWAGLAPLPVMASGMLLFACGPMVSLLYLCVIVEIAAAARGVVRGAVGVLASVGRMALTNYLMHTVVFTSIFYWWGLGMFGELSRPERMALVPMLFAVQCIISPLWLRVFRFGPMEWVWRTLTYLRPQPVLARRGPASGAEGGGA